MKLKDNQIAVYTIRYEDDTYAEDYIGRVLYFIGKEAKGLRRNTRNLRRWDGNNWQEEEIKFQKIIEFEDSDFKYNRGTSFFYLTIKFADGTELKLKQSNTSGSLTPYWKED